MTIAESLPPKPSEVETAQRIFPSRASFATNVANYTVLHGSTELYTDYMGNPCHDEMTYVQQMGDFDK